MKLIDGKTISAQIKDELKEQVATLKEQGVELTLAVIQVGEDPASSVYVRNKKNACAYIGIESVAYELPEETTEEELLTLIEKLNQIKLKKVHVGISYKATLPWVIYRQICSSIESIEEYLSFWKNESDYFNDLIINGNVNFSVGSCYGPS